MSAVVLGYSEKQLTADLQAWWNDQVEPEDDPFAEAKAPRKGTIFEIVPVVDSLGVVAALLAIEKHVGFEVPAGIIKRGGYASSAEMIDDLLPKVHALALKKKSKEEAA